MASRILTPVECERIQNARIQARQLASRLVTVVPRECSCISCERGPRRPAYMLVNGNVEGTPLTLASMPALLRDLRAS